MAFNPSPKVAAARDIARQFKKTQIVVLLIDQDAGTLEYASYGETKELCKEAKILADVAYDAVMAKLAE